MYLVCFVGILPFSLLHCRKLQETCHGVKISAVRAAQLVGRNERRIRDWIATRRLPAIKVGQTWQIDIDDLEQLPGVVIDREQLALLQRQEAATPHGLLNRIHDLEDTVQLLQSEVVALRARINDIEHQHARRVSNAERVLELLHAEHAAPLDQLQPKYSTTASIFSQPENLSESASGQEVEPPPGSVRVKQFALLHKVHAAVLAYQIETGKIEDTALSMANGRKAHWLTPEQQQTTIAFWRRNGTHFIICPMCPHNAALIPG
jgi:hypothetical protein